jgi:hypothetical protein
MPPSRGAARQAGDARYVQVMTTVTTCSNPAEAMLLRSLLEANGIPAFVPDELSAQTAPNFTGSGLHLQVADEHAETAKKIIDEAAESFAGEETDADDEDESSADR